MPLFRFHRGDLHESLQTTVIVKDMKNLREILKPSICSMFFIESTDDFTLDINPYPSDENNFDERIGWFTQIVVLNINCPQSNKVMKSINCAPIGFLSEPFDV